MANGRRLIVFDWLRLWATVVVVHHHAALAYYGSPYRRWYVLNPRGTIVFDAIFRVIDPFMMPLFFILSGYFTARALRPKPERTAFLRRRVERLALPFVVGTITILPWLMYLKRISQQHYRGGMLAYVTEVYFREDIRAGYLWFLSTLLMLQLLAWAAAFVRPTLFAPLAEGQRKPPSWRGLLAFIGVCALGQLSTHLFYAEYAWVEWGGTGVVTFQPTRQVLYLVSFAAGGYGWRHQWRWTDAPFAKPAIALPCLLLTSLCQIAFSYFYYAKVADSLALKAINALIFASTSAATLAASLVLCSKLERRFENVAWLPKLSRSSYAVYLVHMPVVITLQFALLNWDAAPALKYLVVFGVGATLSFGVAGMLIERVPLLRRILG